MRTILLVTAAALALGACDKTGGAKTGDGAAASTPVSTAAGYSLPKRRAGLWEQVIVLDGKPESMGKFSECIGASTHAKPRVFGGGTAKMMDCQRSVSRGLDGSYAYSSTCNLGQGGKMTAKESETGDFSSNYKIVRQSDTTGAASAAMNGHHVMEIDATYAGACPAGMTPGDISVNGTIMNIRKVLEAHGAAPKS